MASLFVFVSKDNQDYYPLGKRITVVGRDEGLPIQILDDFVSRKHLQIAYEAESENYFANDMDSKHGVFIEGHRIARKTQLQDGDVIKIGNTNLLFTLKDFPDNESALEHFKKVGERYRNTITE